MATTITRTLGPGLTVTGTINQNGILIYTITLPSGTTVIVTDQELGSLTIREVGLNAWLFTVGTLAVGSTIYSDDRGAILTLQSSFEQIRAIGAELLAESPVAGEEAEEAEEDPIENEEPEDVEDPEELDGYGYKIPEEEDPIEYEEPEDVEDPEELDGYGYTIPEEPEGELALTREPDYGDEPPDIDVDGAFPYGDDYQYGDNEPVLDDDGNPTGSYFDDDGNEFDPDGDIENEGPGSGPGQGSRGLVGGRNRARSSAVIQDQYRTNSLGDWRVTLSLAENANYLYKAQNPGILAPLAATDGVIFPYTPQIQTTYAANYEATSPTHSNYKIFQYGTSAVDAVSITCDFTAQDTFEANYLLAVIHFFKSVTKMFYGQDENPKRGTPPPLVFLNGLGAFQYNRHPLVINNFTYNLPNDVDYIRAYLTPTAVAEDAPQGGRLGTTILPGGIVPRTVYGNNIENTIPTYVPTRIQLQVSAYPIVTRNRISNEFSLVEYGNGDLLNKGIW